jgi:hypothetical protein
MQISHREFAPLSAEIKALKKVLSQALLRK